MSQNQKIWKNVRNFHPLGMLEMNTRRSLKISTSQKEKKTQHSTQPISLKHNPLALNATH
jgi:hypothetical protein